MNNESIEDEVARLSNVNVKQRPPLTFAEIETARLSHAAQFGVDVGEGDNQTVSTVRVSDLEPVFGAHVATPKVPAFARIKSKHKNKPYNSYPINTGRRLQKTRAKDIKLAKRLRTNATHKDLTLLGIPRNIGSSRLGLRKRLLMAHY